MTRGMSDVDGITEAVKTNSNATDITVTNSVDMFTLNTIGTYVETTMEVMRAGFAKVPRQ